MEHNTLVNFSYVITVTAAPVTVYAVSKNGERVAISSFTEPGQHSFLAQTARTLIEGEYKFFSGPLQRGIAATSNGGGAGAPGADGKDAFELWKEQTGQPEATWDDFMAALKGEKGDPGEKGEQGEPGEVDAEQLAAAVADAVNDALGISKVIELGAGADENINGRSLEIAGVHLPEGLEVAAVKLLARSGGSTSGEPVYLSAWEREGGDNFRLLAVSTNTQVQQVGQWGVWEFDGLTLSGGGVLWAALATPETPFAQASELYMRVMPREDDDSCIIHTSSTQFRYHPAMQIVSAAQERFAPVEHVGDDSHLQDGERAMWSAAAEQAGAAQSTAQNALATAQEAKTDAAAASAEVELVRAEAEAAQTAAQHALNEAKAAAEQAQRTASEAVTAATAAAEQAGQAMKDYSDVSSELLNLNLIATQADSKAEGVSRDLSGHISNMSMHVSEEEREQWNRALANGGGSFNDTGNILGGEATADLGTAAGFEAQATGRYSSAMGCGAMAKGDYSIAVGGNSEAVERNSIAIGYNAQAQATSSIAIGYNAQAGDGSVALGYSANAEEYSVSVGYISHSGSGGFSIGYGAYHDYVGCGLFYVDATPGPGDSGTTQLMLIAKDSDYAKQHTDGEAGLALGYVLEFKRFLKLEKLFDLVERADEILAKLG